MGGTEGEDKEMKMKKNKKGHWIGESSVSWILIIALVVAVGYALYKIIK